MQEMSMLDAQLELITQISQEENNVETEFERLPTAPLSDGDKMKVVNYELFKSAAERLMEAAYIRGRLMGLSSAHRILIETCKDLMSPEEDTKHEE